MPAWKIAFISHAEIPWARPMHISGVIVNNSDQVMAIVETIYEGMGQFSFTPQPGESYRLKIVKPADIKEEPKLPAPITDCPIVLTTGTGVFGPSEPLEFNIRSSKANIPLVVGAWCRGVLVGQVGSGYQKKRKWHEFGRPNLVRRRSAELSALRCSITL